MTTPEILALIARKLQDPSYTDSMLLQELNYGLRNLAYKIPLPSLITSAVVDTVLDQDYVSMPADYQTRLVFVSNTSLNSETKCELCYNRQTIRNMNALDAVGDVQFVAEEGGLLFYMEIPAESQSLKLTYYALPTVLTDEDTSSPDCVPAAHHMLLVNYVVSQIFAEIEDGIEGQKVNTTFYLNKYLLELEVLENEMPDPSLPRRYYPRMISTF